MNSDFLTNPNPSNPARHDIVWPIEVAAGSLLRTGVTPLLLRGHLGSLWQTSATVPIYADLQTLVMPGLCAFGIEAFAAPLTEQTDALEMGQKLLPIFDFGGAPIDNEEADGELKEDAEPEALGQLAERDRVRTVARSGLLREVTAERIIWQEASGEMQSCSHQDFSGRFTHGVALRGLAIRKETRRVALMGAIGRATLFALANPDRFLTSSEEDADRRSEAAQFLADAAGKQRDPVSLRWRQAGKRLADGDVEAALDRLYDALILSLDLPDAIRAALARPIDAPLTSLQRSDLIYLARAGSRDLKTLAVCRLAGAIAFPDVQHTLEQMAYASDPLVRAAAARGLSVLIGGICG